MKIVGDRGYLLIRGIELDSTEAQYIQVNGQGANSLAIIVVVVDVY